MRTIAAVRADAPKLDRVEMQHSATAGRLSSAASGRR
jgi:hypothetical protein